MYLILDLYDMEHGARHIGDTPKNTVKMQQLWNTYFIYMHMEWVNFSAHVNFNHLGCQYNANSFEM